MSYAIAFKLYVHTGNYLRNNSNSFPMPFHRYIIVNMPSLSKNGQWCKHMYMPVIRSIQGSVTIIRIYPWY